MKPVTGFTEETGTWRVNCTCCQSHFQNTSLINLRRRFSLFHWPHFTSPMKTTFGFISHWCPSLEHRWMCTCSVCPQTGVKYFRFAGWSLIGPGSTGDLSIGDIIYWSWLVSPCKDEVIWKNTSICVCGVLVWIYFLSVLKIETLMEAVLMCPTWWLWMKIWDRRYTCALLPQKMKYKQNQNQ